MINMLSHAFINTPKTQEKLKVPGYKSNNYKQQRKLRSAIQNIKNIQNLVTVLRHTIKILGKESVNWAPDK